MGAIGSIATWGVVAAGAVGYPHVGLLDAETDAVAALRRAAAIYVDVIGAS